MIFLRNGIMYDYSRFATTVRTRFRPWMAARPVQHTALSPVILFLLFAALGFFQPPGLSSTYAFAQSVAAYPGQEGAPAQIEFNLPAPTEFRLSVEQNWLIVDFSQPYHGTLAPVTNHLPHLIAQSSVTRNGTRIRLQLHKTMTVHGYSPKTGQIIIELVDKDAGKIGKSAEAAGSPEPANRSETVPIQRAELVNGGTRLVLGWANRVQYRLRKQNGKTVLTFNRLARFVLPNGEDSPANGMLRAIDTVPGPASSITLHLRQDARLRHFRSGPKVVIDITDSRTADAPVSSSVPQLENRQQLAQAPTFEDDGAPPPRPRRQRAPREAETARPRATTTTDTDRPAAPRQGVQRIPLVTGPAEPTQVQPPRTTPVPPKSPASTPAAKRQIEPRAKTQQQKKVKIQRKRESDAYIYPDPLQKFDLGRISSTLGSRAQRPSINQPAEVTLVRGKDGATIIINNARRQPVAIFVRNDRIWVVFDRRHRLGYRFSNFPTGAADPVGRPERLEQRELSGDILTFPLKIGFNPTVARQQTAWLIHVAPAPTFLTSRITSAARKGPGGRSERIFNMSGASQTVPFNDPQTGVRLFATPYVSEGYGVASVRNHPDYVVLPSAQGLVVESSKNVITVQSTEQGPVAYSPTDLPSSDDRDVTDSRRQVSEKTKEIEIPALFPLEKWRGSESWSFFDRLAFLNEKITKAMQGGRGPSLNQARRELAEFYFAHGLSYETLAQIEMLLDRESGDPSFLNDRVFRAMRGVTQFLIGRVDIAEQDLALSSLDGEPEAEMWRGAVDVIRGRFKKAGPRLADNAELIKRYWKSERFRLHLLGADANIGARNFGAAADFIDRIGSDSPNDRELDQSRYLRGLIEARSGARQVALQTFKALLDSSDQKARSHAAYALIDLRLGNRGAAEESEDAIAKGKEIIARAGKDTEKPAARRLRPSSPTLKKAIIDLERLQFAWRGDVFEFNVLTRLGELYLEAKRYRDALHALRKATVLFPSIAQARTAEELMRRTFTELFLGQSGKNLPPLAILSIYDEFQELTPVGKQGDQIVRGIVERLEKIDLLPRAAETLRTQITEKLSGEAKAIAGAELARIQLLDHQPERALEALDISDTPDLHDQIRGGRRYLRARALADVGKSNRALELLFEDEAPEADQLKARIAWEIQDWETAAEAYARLVGVGPTTIEELNPRQSENIMNWAISLSLSEDLPVLVALRKRFSALMSEGPHADAFALVTMGISPGEERVTITSQLNSIEIFESFLRNYRERFTASP